MSQTDYYDSLLKTNGKFDSTKVATLANGTAKTYEQYLTEEKQKALNNEGVKYAIPTRDGRHAGYISYDDYVAKRKKYVNLGGTEEQFDKNNSNVKVVKVVPGEYENWTDMNWTDADNGAEWGEFMNFILTNQKVSWMLINWVYRRMAMI